MAAPPSRRSTGRTLAIIGAVLLVVVVAALAFAKLRSDQILEDVNDIVNPSAGGVVSTDCADTLAPFTDALTDLNSRLSVGLNFSAYSERVADARVAYDRIPFGSLDATCVRLVGQPEEDAFNAYVRAYSTWNDCISDAQCETDSIDSKLQAEWAKATNLLDSVRERLP